jgi:murein DD-endopeptidase MepM/ murein hydrolase activator NlpD
MLAIERRDGAFHAAREQATEEVRTMLRSGEIRSSLFGAADAAGIPDTIMIALADVFAGDIDFYHDLRRGDRFTVVYEARFVDWRADRHRAASSPPNSRTAARRCARSTGATPTATTATSPRTAAARAARSCARRWNSRASPPASRWRAFIRSCKQWRRTKGIDYAAPTGTPVRVTADGVVTFAGEQNGYGNVILVRHQGTYSTVYGHLSRFAPELKDGRARSGKAIRSAMSG